MITCWAFILICLVYISLEKKIKKLGQKVSDVDPSNRAMFPPNYWKETNNEEDEEEDD